MEEIQNIIYQSCLHISNYIRSGNSHHHGSISGTNSSADDVKHLDLWTNDLLKTNLLQCRSIRYISSEEDENIITTPYIKAPYLIAFDPLDGSNNIDVNISIGTIFAVYKLNKFQVKILLKVQYPYLSLPIWLIDIFVLLSLLHSLD